MVLGPVLAVLGEFVLPDAGFLLGGLTFSPLQWSLGASLIAMGLTAREAIPITFFGFFLCGIIIAINAQIGASTHCSFPVLIRASMGMWGSYPAILVRCILSLLWVSFPVAIALRQRS